MSKHALAAFAAMMMMMMMVMVASCAEPADSTDSTDPTEAISAAGDPASSGLSTSELSLVDEAGQGLTCPFYNPPGFRCQTNADCFSVCQPFGDLGGSCLPTLKCCICRL